MHRPYRPQYMDTAKRRPPGVNVAFVIPVLSAINRAASTRYDAVSVHAGFTINVFPNLMTGVASVSRRDTEERKIVVDFVVPPTSH